jgi:alkylation response protein AidB-like acyl-CoA dehydrogenase
MDIAYPAQASVFRDRVREFLGRHLPPDWRGIGMLDEAAAERFSDEWRLLLREEGLLAVAWPKRYGGAELSPLEQVVLAEELTRAGVPDGDPNDRFGIRMLGNTLIARGTEDQCRHFLPRVISAEDRWCQGFSEPDAGSDLASLRCRAELVGDEWIIDGQKIWTSLAHRANWIFLLARTNPDAPRHRGISFLLCPLDQPGVEVKPIRMASGVTDFCEVFFDGARVRADHVVGGVDNGWQVAMTLLTFERGEAAATFPIQFREEFDRILVLARQQERLDDAEIRSRLVNCFIRVEVMRYLGLAALTRFVRGQPPGTASSISKLYWSEYHRDVTELAVDILGPDILTPSGRSAANAVRTDHPGSPPSSSAWLTTYLGAQAGTVYAGSSEIQRNILSEQVLGLPKEPRPE